jgi:hypothetical protein
MMHSIVLYFWCHYCFNDDELVPSLDFIENEQFMFYGSFNKEKITIRKNLLGKQLLLNINIIIHLSWIKFYSML